MKFNFSTMLLTLLGATTAPAVIAADQDVVIGVRDASRVPARIQIPLGLLQSHQSHEG